MLSTFVIGLREGLEAALIVGIVAAFLRTNGRLDLLRWVWAGVGAAIVLCLGVGIALRTASQNLPYRQQEGLETVIALVAVVMVSYMVVWMRRHARSLKHDLEGASRLLSIAKRGRMKRVSGSGALERLRSRKRANAPGHCNKRKVPNG